MPFHRAYQIPATHSRVQPTSRPARKPPVIRAIALILAFGVFAPAQDATQEGPPLNIVKRVAQRETETQKERNEYTYRQTVTLDELDDHGGIRGQYRETRDVIFSPEHDRTEQLLGAPDSRLKNLILTEEDFADIRNIQPLVLTDAQLWNYETKFRGDETVDGVECWVL